MPGAFAVIGIYENMRPTHRYIQSVADFAARSLVGSGAWADIIYAADGYVCKHFYFVKRLPLAGI